MPVAGSENKRLVEATVQEIQLELIRRSQFNAFYGEKVVSALLAHQDLWQAVIMDSFCFSNPGKLPSGGLIKLRDLHHNHWNVDTIYILTPDASSAHQLAHIAEDWAGMVRVFEDAENIQATLGGAPGKPAIVSVWWD